MPMTELGKAKGFCVLFGLDDLMTKDKAKPSPLSEIFVAASLKFSETQGPMLFFILTLTVRLLITSTVTVKIGVHIMITTYYYYYYYYYYSYSYSCSCSYYYYYYYVLLLLHNRAA